MYVTKILSQEPQKIAVAHNSLNTKFKCIQMCDKQLLFRHKWTDYFNYVSLSIA